MADSNSQPMILVKKIDGTTERISLAELKKRQTASKISPLTSLGRNDNKEEVRNNKTEKPLLHEEAPVSPHAVTTVVADRADQVGKIIASLSFTVPAQFENRLRSCIQLRLKDIRSEADTLDVCLRSIKDGGLGLTEAQAQEIVEKSKPTTYKPEIKVPVSQLLAPSQSVIDKIIQQGDVPILPIPALRRASTPAATMASSKPMMHDVKNKPLSMNPLEEIQYFSLIDLRRLGNNASEAVSRFKQKFVNLKEESFSLFMDSWNAWRQSPLFINLMEVVDIAVLEKRHLSAVLGEKEKISLAEIEALITMEKELEI